MTRKWKKEDEEKGRGEEEKEEEDDDDRPCCLWLMRSAAGLSLGSPWFHHGIIGHCEGCQNLMQIRMITSNSRIFGDNQG